MTWTFSGTRGQIAWRLAPVGLAACLGLLVGCTGSESSQAVQSQLASLEARLAQAEQAWQADAQLVRMLTDQLTVLQKEHAETVERLDTFRKEIYSGAGGTGDPARLIPYINHSDQEVRRAAMTLVSRLRVKQAGPLLVEIVERDPDGSMRVAALDALEKIRPDQYETLLVKLLTDRESAVASRAAQILGNSRDAKFVRPLGEALQANLARLQPGRGARSFYRPSQSILQALGTIGHADAVPYLLVALEADNSYMAGEAARHLRRVADKKILPQVLALIRRKLTSAPKGRTDPAVAALMDILVDQGAPEATPMLVDMLAESPSLRRRAEGNLMRLARGGAFEALATALSTGKAPAGKPLDLQARRSLVKAIAASSDPRFVKVLLDALEGAPAELAQQIARGLRGARDASQTPRLLAAWQKATDGRVRAELAQVLRSGGYPVIWNAQSQSFTLDPAAGSDAHETPAAAKETGPGAQTGPAPGQPRPSRPRPRPAEAHDAPATTRF